MPPLVSLLVNIIQNSTIAQVIGAPELLESAERQVERLAAPPPIGIGEVKALPIYAAVMLIFFLISFPLTRLSAYLEKRRTDRIGSPRARGHARDHRDGQRADAARHTLGIRTFGGPDGRGDARVGA